MISPEYLLLVAVGRRPSCYFSRVFPRMEPLPRWRLFHRGGSGGERPGVSQPHGIILKMPKVRKTYAAKRRRAAAGPYSRVGARYRPGPQDGDSERVAIKRARTQAVLTRQVVPHSGVQVFPPKRNLTLSYSDYFTVAIGVAGVSTDYMFRLNSLFDPDLTGTGHQPLGHDQLATIYNKYRVKRTDWEIVIPPVNETGAVSWFPSNSATAYSGSSMSVPMEQPFSDSRALKYYEPTIIKGGIDMATLWGGSKEEYLSSDNTLAAFAASPTENLIGHLMLVCANTTTFRVMISFTFTCEVFDPNFLAQS